MPTLTEKTLKEIFTKTEFTLSQFKTFIETGSHMGHTIDNMLPYFENLITIEVSEKYYNIVKDKFKDTPKVKCIYGDSGLILENILPEKKELTIFWLDGHYSSGDTGKGIKDCPLIEELKIIDKHFTNTVIIIDDYRMFGVKGAEDWTDITDKNVKNCFKKIKNIFSMEDRLIICI